MANALNELVSLLPPPAHPHATNIDWAIIESHLGLILPSDYKAFTKLYGSVTICEVLGVLHPLSAPNGDWRADNIALLRDVIDAVKGGRANFTYPNYPDPGGLFPILQRENDLVCWITEGPSDQWRLLYWSTWGTVVHELPMSLTEFLVAILSRRFDWIENEFPDFWFGPESEYRKAEPYIPAPQFQPPDEYYRKHGHAQ